MRRPFIAGNWKMNLTRDAAVALARAIVAQAGTGKDGTSSKVEMAVCPPFVYLDAVREAIKGSAVELIAGKKRHRVAVGSELQL